MRRDNADGAPSAGSSRKSRERVSAPLLIQSSDSIGASCSLIASAIYSGRSPTSSRMSSGSMPTAWLDFTQSEGPISQGRNSRVNPSKATLAGCYFGVEVALTDSTDLGSDDIVSLRRCWRRRAVFASLAWRSASSTNLDSLFALSIFSLSIFRRFKPTSLPPSIPVQKCDEQPNVPHESGFHWARPPPVDNCACLAVAAIVPHAECGNSNCS